jgi:hypothetical protein
MIAGCIILDLMGGKVVKVIRSSYGSTQLLKATCPNCGVTAFIIDSIIQCDCNYRIKRPPTKVIDKRETTTEVKRSLIPMTVKRTILENQGNRCIYCDNILDGFVWNTKRNRYTKNQIHFDHFLAWSYSGDNHDYNILASCHICNMYKSSKYFPTVKDAREYILKRRKEKGYLD